MSPKDRERLVGGASFLLVLFFGFKIWIAGDLDYLKNARKETATSLKKETLLREISNLKHRFGSVESNLAKNKNADWLIEEVSRLAASSGLALWSAVPQVPQDATGFQKISLLIEAAGNYHELGLFIEKIENHRPLIKIQNLRAADKGDPNSTDRLQLSISLAAYFYDQGKTL